MSRSACLSRVVPLAAQQFHPVIYFTTVGFLTDFTHLVILIDMNTTAQSDTVWFTTKGQVVIPLRIRKLFHIEDGTRAIVTATSDGILLKPVTAAMIERGFGLLKCKPKVKPLSEEWPEHKREEREKEESKYARHGSR
jgi:AbrB family looped-hinge helix DNA binding protein